VSGTILSLVASVMSDPARYYYETLSELILTSESFPVVPITAALFRNLAAILIPEFQNHMSALGCQCLFVAVYPQYTEGNRGG